MNWSRSLSYILLTLAPLILAGTLSRGTEVAPPTSPPAAEFNVPAAPVPSARQDVLHLESPPPSSPAEPTGPSSPLGVVCTPGRLWHWRESCPEHGPGATAYRLAHTRLPDSLPELPLVEFALEPDEDVVPYIYAYVRTVPLSVYHHPMEAQLHLPPVRILYSGDQWVSVEGEVEFDGERWIQINEGEFVPADALAFARPSRFQGVYLTGQPSYPFAWVNRAVHPSITPQGPQNPDGPLYRRYELVTIYGREFRGIEELWYLIGPDQWVRQDYLSVVTLDPPPPGVGSGERWIEVDLFEQTLAAYEGGRMVYATLISSGRPGTWTDAGLFRIWAKFPAKNMSNPDEEDGSPYWYHLEDVPWTMYFDGPTALHAAYWHDNFGFTYSHGCVNLAPRDAEWLFNWTSPYVPPDAGVVHASGSGTWIWVHTTSPFDG